MLHLVRRSWLAVCCLALCATPAWAQRKPPSAAGAGQGDFKKVDFTESDWSGAYYTVFIPKGIAPGRTYPLVMALHGNGQKSDGAVRNLAKVSTAALPCFVVAPQYQQGYEFNNPRYPRTAEMFKQCLDAVCAEYPIDRSRLVLQGFSMGGNYMCSWTYQWFTEKPDAYPFAALWMSSTAVPPSKGQNAPKIPYLLFTGSKETAVKGVVNVVKMTRETYRVLHGLGLDVRYIEIPNMGHAVNNQCHDYMRESLASLPTYGDAASPVRGLPDAGVAALQHAAAGRFTEAFKTLEALQADDSQLSSTEKSKVKSQISALEKWCKGFASTEPKRLAMAFTKTAYDGFKALATQLAEHDALGKTFERAVDKLDKVKMVQAELKAYEEFQAACQLEDAAAREQALLKLSKGPLQMTVYGDRAASHLQALSDTYE